MNVIDGDCHVQGRLTANSMTLADNSVGNLQVSTLSPITADKFYHQHQQIYQQPHGTAVADARTVVHVARGSGTFHAVQAGLVVAITGDSTITVNVYKNGVTVLSATIALDNGDAAFGELNGAIASAAYVAGDVFEVVVDATVGTGTLGQGLYVVLVFRELAGA